MAVGFASFSPRLQQWSMPPRLCAMRLSAPPAFLHLLLPPHTCLLVEYLWEQTGQVCLSESEDARVDAGTQLSPFVARLWSQGDKGYRPLQQGQAVWAALRPGREWGMKKGPLTGPLIPGAGG